jgi:ABC-2 type transport system permease protein
MTSGSTPNGAGVASSGGRAQWLRLALLVARRDYVRTVRRRGFIFGTLLLPFGVAVLMAISGFFASGGASGPTSVSMVVVNESEVSLEESAAAVPGVTVVTREQARAMLDEGAINHYYLVPAGYPMRPTVSRVEQDRGEGIAGLEADSLREELLGTLLQAALLRDAGVGPQEARQIQGGVQVDVVSVEGDPVTGVAVAASIVAPILFVAIFMVSIFITSGYLLQSVTEEKENRVVEIVLSSVPSGPLMGGKILGLGAAGLTQVGIWVGTAIIATPLLADRFGDVGDVLPGPTVLVLAIAYFVLGYLAYGTLFAAIGAIAPGNREAQQYSGFFGFIAAIPFIMLASFLADLQSLPVYVLAIFPLTAPTTMLLVLGLAREIPWELVGASMTSLILFVALATWAAGRIFHATVLLYGARPSVGGILQALRTSR